MHQSDYPHGEAYFPDTAAMVLDWPFWKDLGSAGAPPLSKRRLRRWTCRTVRCRAAAAWRLVMRPASAALIKPARGNSFRLIVKVSMGSCHFHGAVTP